MVAREKLSDQTDRQLVEWCAGKGHLSRRLLERDCRHEVIALENPALIGQGIQIAADQGLGIRFEQQDVLAASVARFCSGDLGVTSRCMPVAACMSTCCATAVLAGGAN